jgi:chromosome segregation ATPase
LERNDSSALRIVDSGVITEMVNNTSKAFTDRDLEAVTDELISTQEKLIKTEEQLLRSQTLVQDLERNIQNIDNDAPASLSGDDKELLRELDEIRAEIGATKSKEGIQSPSVGTQQSKEKVANYESELKGSREENTKLMEEIACLRNILYDQGDSRTAMEKRDKKSARNEKVANQVHEDHQIEIQSLRKQIDATVNENMILQEQIQRLEMFGSSQGSRSGESITAVEGKAVGEKFRQTKEKLEKSQQECSEMRNEVLALSESLYKANQRRAPFNLTGLKQQDNQLLLARNELVDKNREISTLENKLTSTQEEVKKLSEEISKMISAFEKAQEEHNSVVEELQQTESALAAAKASRESQETKLKRLQSVASKAPQKDAEIQVLRSQFKKLSEKNGNLSQQVNDVMGEVASVREKQDKANTESKARVTIARELQNDFIHAMSETSQQNCDVEELTHMIESRMGMTELSIEALDSEIAVAMKCLQSAQASSLDRKLEPIGSVLPTDCRYDEIDSEIIETEEKEEVEEKEETEKEEAPVAVDTMQTVLERTRRLLEVSETVQKLTMVSKSLREGRQNDNEQISMSTVSLHDRKDSKYVEIIQKVANFESLYSNENRELEAHGDDGIDVRE